MNSSSSIVKYAVAIPIIFFFSVWDCDGQTLSPPVSVETRADQPLRVKINVLGIGKYHLLMEGNPIGSKIEHDEFVWVPLSGEDNDYLVRFTLLDSAYKKVTDASMLIRVDRSGLTPYLAFTQHMSDTIDVIENERFFFTASLRSRVHSDARLLAPYFLFNENAALRSFDSCRITRMGDQISFEWTPSKREAIDRYAKLRITIVDSDKSIGSKILNFKIKEVNQPPSFLHAVVDTIFFSESHDLRLDFSGVDPDKDGLIYDYAPKNPLIEMEGGVLTVRTNSTSGASQEFPKVITVSLSDGSHVVKRTVRLIRNQSMLQPLIADFTRKLFSEGDSIVTYLNINNGGDLRRINIKFNDLSLPPGINGLSSRLSVKKTASYVKIFSKGPLPYYQVDRDYTYNLGVTIAGAEENATSFKVLELSIEDRDDPTYLGRQKDSLLTDVARYIRTESYYSSSLEKVYKRISRPWWKKAAAITGTLSGILVLVQTQDQNKSVSFASAGVSLLAIMVANVPNLSEKSMTDLNDKITGAKARISRVQEKESDFTSAWTYDAENSNFEKMKNELQSLLRSGREKRAMDICGLLSNPKMKRKIDRLIKQNAVKKEGSIDPGVLFQCNTSSPN